MYTRGAYSKLLSLSSSALEGHRLSKGAFIGIFRSHLEGVLRGVERGVDKFREYLHIPHEQELAERHDEGDDEKCGPDVI